MANRKLTKEDFIRRAKDVHGSRFDYSKSEYKGYKERICIICPIHGEFWTTPQIHLGGSMCPQCKFEKQKIGLDEFLRRAKEIHGEKYGYSKVKYVNNSTKVCITCPAHGDFWQTAGDHLQGHGCPKCFGDKRGESRRSTQEEFIRRAKEVHGDKYDYSKVNYVNSTTKVCIICPKHGEFWQTPSKHLIGRGCPLCKNKATGDRFRKSQKDFIKEAQNKHGETYDYSLVKYEGVKRPIKIICPTHGVFEQTPRMHLKANIGCPKCAIVALRKKVYGVGVNDILESTNEYYYTAWHAMLSRCYSKREKGINSSYIGCSVCEEWHRLSSFKEWFDKHYVEGWALDKDILVKGNKVYSPETCCFVPQEINTMFTKRVLSDDKKSVFPHKDGYGCLISRNNKTIRIYGFKTREEALAKHKKELENHMHDLADKYKEQLAPNVYNIISTYKI